MTIKNKRMCVASVCGCLVEQVWERAGSRGWCECEQSSRKAVVSSDVNYNLMAFDKAFPQKNRWDDFLLPPSKTDISTSWQFVLDLTNWLDHNALIGKRLIIWQASLKLMWDGPVDHAATLFLQGCESLVVTLIINSCRVMFKFSVPN